MRSKASCIWRQQLSFLVSILLLGHAQGSNLLYRAGDVYEYSYFAGSWSAHNQDQSADLQETSTGKIHDSKMSALLRVAMVGREVSVLPDGQNVNVHLLALEVVNPVCEQRNSQGMTHEFDYKVKVSGVSFSLCKLRNRLDFSCLVCSA